MGEEATSNVAAAAPPPPPTQTELSALRRLRRETRLKNVLVGLRAGGCFFSALAFLLMITNKHGDWKEFSHYEEFRYAAAIFAFGFLYTAAKIVLQVFGGDNLAGGLSARAVTAVDFATDQVIAYLMISAISAAIPMTNRMREGSDNIFTDALAASISMAFFSFLALSLSAMATGYKLSTQTYI